MTILLSKPAVGQRVRDQLFAPITEDELGRKVLRQVDELVELGDKSQHPSAELEMLTEASAELSGFGVLEPLLANQKIEEVWINGADEVRFAVNGKSFKADIRLPHDALENLVFRLLRHSSRRVDRMHPFADATLADGSRVHVVIPPVTAHSWIVNIRKFPPKTRSLGDLVQLGMVTQSQANELAAAMRDGANLLISGATHTGKTTLLSALLGELPPQQRVISIEETHELRLANPDWVAMQGRNGGFGEAEEIDLRRLVREALRMRPEYLVVGEVRGAEALELMLAMNSGIPCAGTIHAKSAAAAISKLQLLPTLAQANIDAGFISAAVREVLDVVVHIRSAGELRRIQEILWLKR